MVKVRPSVPLSVIVFETVRVLPLATARPRAVFIWERLMTPVRPATDTTGPPDRDASATAVAAALAAAAVAEVPALVAEVPALVADVAALVAEALAEEALAAAFVADVAAFVADNVAEACSA